MTKTAEIKTELILRMYRIYLAAGHNPHQYCSIQLGNEIAIGGAGAPTETTWFTNTGVDPDALGLWDNPGSFTENQTNGASAIGFLTKELGLLDTLGIPCIAPSFACKDLENELLTFDADFSVGVNWIDIIRAKSPLAYGISCYYNVFVLGSSGCREQLYVWPSLGATRFAKVAVNGFDGGGKDSYDEFCKAVHFKMMRAHERIRRNDIVVCEAGLRPAFAGMTDFPGTNPVGEMLQNYHENYQEVGKMSLAFIKELKSLEPTRVILFTITNTGPDWEDRFGLFADTIDISTTLANPASYPAARSFSSQIPWAEKAGRRAYGTVPPTPTEAAFWGTNLVKGDKEVLPEYEENL